MKKFYDHFVRLIVVASAYGYLDCAEPVLRLSLPLSSNFDSRFLGNGVEPLSNRNQVELSIFLSLSLRNGVEPLSNRNRFEPTIFLTSFGEQRGFSALPIVTITDEVSKDFFESPSDESKCVIFSSTPHHDRWLFIETGPVFRSRDAGSWRIEIETTPDYVNDLGIIFDSGYSNNDAFFMERIPKLPNSAFTSKVATEHDRDRQKIWPRDCARVSLLVTAVREGIEYALLKKIKNKDSDAWSYFDGFVNSTDLTFLKAIARVTQEDSNGIIQETPMIYQNASLVAFPRTGWEFRFIHRVYFQNVAYVDLSENESLTWVSVENLKNLFSQLKPISLKELRYQYRYFITDIEKRSIRLDNLCVSALAARGFFGSLEK